MRICNPFQNLTKNPPNGNPLQKSPLLMPKFRSWWGLETAFPHAEQCWETYGPNFVSLMFCFVWSWSYFSAPLLDVVRTRWECRTMFFQLSRGSGHWVHPSPVTYSCNCMWKGWVLFVAKFLEVFSLLKPTVIECCFSRKSPNDALKIVLNAPWQFDLISYFMIILHITW